MDRFAGLPIIYKMTHSESITIEAEGPLEKREDLRDPQKIYRILFLEDNPDDVELMQNELDLANLSYISKGTYKKHEFIDIVKTFQPHVILADYSLQSFDGVKAYKMLRSEGLSVPFILVTGALSEMLALDCLKVGIDDFVLKASYKRLPTAIVRAVEKREAQEAKDKMGEELKKSHEELRQLLHRHHVSLEEERLKIARDLHDELGQMLTALKIDISMLLKKILTTRPFDERYVVNEFQSITNLVDNLTQSVKAISRGLRPETLDPLGILESIKCQAIEFEKRNEIICRTILPDQPLELSKELSIAIYRIVQESLTNISRHAQAEEVEIRLSVAGTQIFLEIKDDGIGIQEDQVHSSKSLGLIGLRERVHVLGGVSTITGNPLDGTIITVILPIK